MLAGALLVWVALVVGLRLLSGGGAWQLGWAGAIGVATLLWPAFWIGYLSLSRLFGSDAERRAELTDSAMQALVGAPAVALGFVWSVLVLGLSRFLQSFGSAPSGGVLNFVMSILALHVLAWGMAGATQWGWSAMRESAS